MTSVVLGLSMPIVPVCAGASPCPPPIPPFGQEYNTGNRTPAAFAAAAAAVTRARPGGGWPGAAGPGGCCACVMWHVHCACLQPGSWCRRVAFTAAAPAPGPPKTGPPPAGPAPRKKKRAARLASSGLWAKSNHKCCTEGTVCRSEGNVGMRTRRPPVRRWER